MGGWVGVEGRGHGLGLQGCRRRDRVWHARLLLLLLSIALMVSIVSPQHVACAPHCKSPDTGLTRLLFPNCRGMLEQWEDDMRANRDLDMAALRAMAPATRRALESSGRSGTTLSFGGGGGGGGGGAGSSW